MAHHDPAARRCAQIARQLLGGPTPTPTAGAAAAPGGATGPLAGMRVLEMGIAIQGPAAALMLSDLGAVRPPLAALATPPSHH